MTSPGASAPRAAQRLWPRLLLAAAAVVLTWLAAEVALRFVYRPGGVLVPGVQWPSGTLPTTSRYVLDPELGYRPRLGGELYGDHGARLNGYPVARRPGVRRVLLLGDSVTYRRSLEVPLARACEGQPVEFWNAGVEGYNAIQEVRYYQRFARRIGADQVILGFHNNDFQVTPVVMAGEGSELTVFLPDRPVAGWRPGLLARSRLYRLWFDWRLARQRPFEMAELAARTEASLRSLQATLAADGTRLSVVVLPILAPLDEWTDEERWSRETSLAMFERLDVEALDLLTPLQAALAAGLEVRADPADRWHPNHRVGRIFGGYLLEHGLLAPELECRVSRSWKRVKRVQRRAGRPPGRQKKDR